MKSRRSLLLPLFLTALAVPASAVAQDAETHVQRGVELRRAGDDEAALAEFRQAYEFEQNGRVLGQMGFAEQALGLWVDAATHLRGALETTHEWVERHRGAIEEAFALVLTNVGRLDVLGGVSGAEVVLDGSLRGTLPLASPLYLQPGTVELSVRASGFQSFDRSVTVTAGQLSRESITLRPEVEDSVTPPAETVRDAVPDSESEPADVGSSDGDDPTLTIAGSVLLGLGVVTAGVLGPVGYVFREDNAALFNEDTNCFLDPSMTRGEQCSDELGAVRMGEALVGIGLGVGGAMAVAGAILIGLDVSSGSSDSASVRCGDGPGDIGVACGGTF